MPQPLPTRLRAKAMLTILALLALGLYGATLFHFGVMMGGGQ